MKPWPKSRNDRSASLITSSYIDFYSSLQYTFFIFTNKLLLYCAIKKIELMTHVPVSFEKVFH